MAHIMRIYHIRQTRMKFPFFPLNVLIYCVPCPVDLKLYCFHSNNTKIIQLFPCAVPFGFPCPCGSYDHDDVIKWKHFPRYWPFVREIHRSPVNSPHKSQWRGPLMFSFICTWINGWVNNGEAGDLRHRAHYDIIVMWRATVWGMTFNI